MRLICPGWVFKADLFLLTFPMKTPALLIPAGPGVPTLSK